MKLGSGIEWAIHCCSLLAAVPRGYCIKVEKLAEFHNLKVPYLRKHFQALSKAGIVTTVTGPQGGYRLARESAKISLLDIYLALEGDEPAFRCTEIRQEGPCAIAGSDYSIPCNIATSMWKAEMAWRHELKQVSLDDVLNSTAKQITSEKLMKIQQWVRGAISKNA